MNPLERFTDDRGRAQAAQDPMAALCTVANVDQHGSAQLRTLVLRNVGDQLAIFVNTTSPKWPQLDRGFALQTYWPSVQLQYRMQVTALPLDTQIVHDSWQLRPDAPKRMDWFYALGPSQSSGIESREVLLQQLKALSLPDPLVAPPNAAGLLIEPQQIERLDLNQDNGVHDRQLYTKSDNTWQAQTLVP